MGRTDQTEKEMNTEAAKESTIQTEQAAEAKSDSMRQAYTFAADVKLKECRYCRVMIPKKARICPNCKITLRKNIWGRALAAVLMIGVIGAGGYGLSAYLGWLPDSAVPVWMARRKPSEAVLAVTTVETAENAAGAKPVETTEVASVVEMDGNADDTEPAGVSDVAKADGVPAPEESDAASELAQKVKNIENAAVKEEKLDENETIKQNGDAKPAAEDMTLQGDEPAEKAAAAEETDDETAAGEDNGETADCEETDASDKTAASDEEQDGGFPEEMDENEAAFRADCVRRGYKELLRNQDYLGTAVWLEAEVVCQVDGGLFDENTYYLCMEEESSGIERYYIIRDDRTSDQTLILEGDLITVYGRLFGNCKLPANLIETRPTVPAVSMLCCDLAEE